MEPEEISPSKGKKFLKIALGVLVVFLLLAGTAFFLTAQKNASNAPQAEVQVPTTIKREYTQEEKSQILAYIAQEAFKDTTAQAEKVRILQSITKQAPKLPVVSIADKVRILQELETKAGQ